MERKYFTACFLYPGIAHYNDNSHLSRVLINKHIKEIADTFLDAPVVTGDHIQPTSANDPIISGRVTRVFCNTEGFVTREGVKVEADNKYYCDFYLDDEESIKEWEKYGYVSCSYEILEAIYPKKNASGEFEKLTYINAPYDAEIKKVKARHLAIVNKPRYEEALIYENSVMSNDKQTESKIEVSDNVFVTFCSSAAEKGREVLAKILDNSKKKENKEDGHEDGEKENSKKKMNKKHDNDIDEEEEEPSDNSKKKKNSKKKENESEEKEMEEEEKEEMKEEKKHNKKEKKDNEMIEIDGEEVSMDHLKSMYRENKKTKHKDNSVNLKSIRAEAIEKANAKAEPITFARIDGKSLYSKK
jgi:hypothetical protein